jgi:hypothetical protein
MATVLSTGMLELPPHLIDPWLEKVANGSTVAALSGASPMQFGAEEAFIFDIGEAELVGQGQAKSPSDVTKDTKSTAPYKFQKTVRLNQEVQWADEDYQMRAIAQILDRIQPALSRALDFGVFHGINPATGERAASIEECLADTTNEVEIAAAKPYTYLDAADTLVLAGGYVPSSVAIDPSWASAFSTARGTNSEQKLYPNFRLSTEVSELDGHRASVSNTVGALGVADTATNIKAFDGDFSGIRWGVQRQLGLEMIQYGDPDGQGDLKRNNQIAFRAEVVYGWGIWDLAAFAKVIDETP